MSTIMQQYIEEAEKALLHTYNRYQVVFEKGDGVFLYDLEGSVIWISFPVSRCLLWGIIIRNMTMR